MALHRDQDQNPTHCPPLAAGRGNPARPAPPDRVRALCFPGARSNGRPMSDNAILAAMRRMGVGKDEMSGHGFRAVARTILDEVLGVRPDYIEHLRLGNFAGSRPNVRADWR